HYAGTSSECWTTPVFTAYECACGHLTYGSHRIPCFGTVSLTVDPEWPMGMASFEALRLPCLEACHPPRPYRLGQIHGAEAYRCAGMKSSSTAVRIRSGGSKPWLKMKS